MPPTLTVVSLVLSLFALVEGAELAGAAVASAITLAAGAAVVHRARGGLLPRQQVDGLVTAPGVVLRDATRLLASAGYRDASSTARTAVIEVRSLVGDPAITLLGAMSAALAWSGHPVATLSLISAAGIAAVSAISRATLRVDLDSRQLGFGREVVPMHASLRVRTTVEGDASSAVLELVSPGRSFLWLAGDRAQLSAVATLLARLLPDLTIDPRSER